MPTRRISFTVESDEIHEAIREYSRSRGFYGPSHLCRAALYEYIRRRPPTDENLRNILNIALK